MQYKPEPPRESSRNKAVEDGLRDLGLGSVDTFVDFANSLSVVCCCCGKVSGVRLPNIAFTDRETILALVRRGYDYIVVQYEEHFLGWIRCTGRPGLGTAFVVACANCLATLLICYRAGNLVHVEQITGLSDLFSALQRAEEKSSKENAQQTPVGLPRLAERETSGAKEETMLSWLEKGTKELEVGRLKEAIACFDMALAINPNIPLVWRNKGVALSRTGNAAEAVACYTKVLDLNPRDSVAWFNKGTTLNKMKRPDEALICFERSIEVDPTDPDVWCNKGMTLHSLGKTQEEISCFDKALELNQEHVEAWLNKGVTLSETGEPHAAIQCFEKALAINPMDADAWINKVVSHLKIGNRSEAAEALERFIDVAEPDDPRLAQAKMWIRNLGAEPTRAYKPDYVLEVNAGKFYFGNGYIECPKCHASFQFDEDPMLIFASDVMVDFCPKCSLFVLVNMMSGRVIFEGFKRSEDKEGRLLELRDQCGPDGLVIDRGRRQ